MHPFFAVTHAVNRWVSENRLTAEAPPAAVAAHIRQVLAMSAAVLENTADIASVAPIADWLFHTLTTNSHTEHLGIRFVLDKLNAECPVSIQLANRPLGSPEALMPACLLCSAVTDENFCAACIDSGNPPRNSSAATHRINVRNALKGAPPLTGAMLDPLWNLVTAATTHRQLRFHLSQCRPLALHPTGTLCVAPPSDHVAQRISPFIRSLEDCFVHHKLTLITVALTCIVDRVHGTDMTATITSCEAIHRRSSSIR
ncbi:hypothetical protein NVS55_40075 (plasmid) [Myxococcus stipitatus]|uniref:hypothetical protein n=1 Tax=Myxococcus stipitatus TaxID=83455 RepID=UPI003144F838